MDIERFVGPTTVKDLCSSDAEFGLEEAVRMRYDQYGILKQCRPCEHVGTCGQAGAPGLISFICANFNQRKKSNSKRSSK